MRLPRTGFQYQATDNPMARLFWGIIPVERAAALFFYEAGAESANILYERMMAREFSEAGFFEGIDLIVPVPLAKKRQRQRGYNQSHCLADGVSQITGLPVSNQVVRRTRFVKSQTQMGRQERQENVADVFEVRDLDMIRGRHVLLVDDVVTTGATMTACARELLKAGDVTLSLLSLALVKP